MHGSELVTRCDVISSGNAAGRAASCAHATTDTLVRINMVFHELLTDMSRALLINDMSQVFISEVS